MRAYRRIYSMCMDGRTILERVRPSNLDGALEHSISVLGNASRFDPFVHDHVHKGWPAASRNHKIRPHGAKGKQLIITDKTHMIPLMLHH